MASTPRKKTVPSRSRSQAGRSSNGMSITFLVVVLFILVLTVFILAFREPLAKLNLSASPTAPSASPVASPSPSPASKPGAKPTSLVVDGGTVEPSPSPSAKPPASASPSPSASPASPDPAASNAPAKASPSPSPSASASATKPGASAKPSHSPAALKSGQGELKSVTLFFTRVQDDGRIVTEKVTRSVSYTESPLVSSIRALLRGPDGTELSQGLISMIPAGTTLLSAWVQDSVANLNFSESFQFNPMGGDGLKAQLRQVVWVATEFPTVKSVQILIEGKKVQYLGGDNVPVGKPLTRANLP